MELRAFCYGEICAGAQGFICFEYYLSRRDQTWPYLKHIAGELSVLEPVLISNAPQAKDRGPVGVDLWAKEHDGNCW